MADPSAEQIAARLLEAAKARAKALGSSIAPEALKAIAQKAAQASAQVIIRAQTQAAVEPQIKLAETSFRRLVDAMIAATGAQRPATLELQHFDAALRSICPIWPIC